MSRKQTLTTQVFISVDGQELPPNLSSAIQSVVVDQHVHLPDMFTITLSDTRSLEVLDSSMLNLTRKALIEANDEQGQKFKLMEGEITSLEPEFNDGMNARLMVRGYDNSHRMFREIRSIAHLNKKDSDLANEFASRAGLSAQVEATSVVYEHIYQDNQSDLAFLTHRAWRIGYECFVQDGKLFFRKPPSGGGGLEITWGFELQTFYPRVTLAEQVDEVAVQGWDVAKQAPIIGKASGNSGKLYPKIPEKKGPQWASSFGNGKFIVVDQPVVSQAEANVLAQARLDELSGAYVQAEGAAFRRPDIKAGRFINIKALGKRLSGDYLITRARHTYTSTGLRTNFAVRGARNGTLSEEIAPERKIHRWPSVVIGKVTNVDDKNKWGRVKLKFPWMNDDVESDWARVVSAGAGPEAGGYMIPDVDDEVIVAFEHGDINQPLVLGGVWNGKHPLPPEAGTDGEQPKTRIWQSRSGHKISLFETSEKNKIEGVTAAGHTITFDDKEKRIIVKSKEGHEVMMDDDKEKKIVIKTKGGHEIVMDDKKRKITVKSTGDIEIEAPKGISLEAGTSMKLKAKTQMQIEAQMIDIKGSGPVSVKGTPINLN